VSKQATDKVLLQKYLNGELDARAMHRLEREAQDDPFLMDALEGYQSAGAGQEANLDELSERLSKRVAEKRARVIPIRMIGIAASVLIVCSAGVWWLNNGHAPAPAPVKNVPERAKKAPEVRSSADTTTELAASRPVRHGENKPVVRHNITTAPQPIDTNIVASEPVAKETAPAQYEVDKNVTLPQQKDTTPLNEVIVMNYKSSKKADTSRLAMLHEVHIKTGRDTAPVQRLSAKVPGADVHFNQSPGDINRLREQSSLGAILTDKMISNNVIRGKVIDQSNGLPIQGASVKVSGTNQATKTDASGFFRIQADTSHAKLEVTTRGYLARQVNAATNARDSVKTIVLAPDQSDELSETIVTGYTSQPKDADAVYITAHPQKGWSALKKYLLINAVSPDKAVGIVKVRFSVDKFGSVSNIKVIKGLSGAANKKAISLIKDGPEWDGNSNKQPETVTLRIRFGK